MSSADGGVTSAEHKVKESQVFRGSYLQGQFVKIVDPNGELKSQNPGDLEHGVTTIPFSFEHVDEAVTAAQQSFPSWKRLNVADRLSAIRRYADLLKKSRENLATCLSKEIGKPLWESLQEVDATLKLIEDAITIGSQTTNEIRIENVDAQSEGVVRFFPRGVMAIVTPPPLPLFTPHAQMIPCLINGNVVVLKASQHAPFTGQMISELFHDSGLPAGAVNVIHGEAEVARRLVSHSAIDGIFMSGAFEGGGKLQKVLSDYWKVVVLEMGSKNATVIWDDCSYDRALHETLYSSFVTSGQRVTNAHRVLIHEKIFDKFVQDFHKLAKKIRVGYGLTAGKEAPFLGPLISEESLEHYLRYQGIAVREGCEEIMRGKTLERDTRGHYVSPSIHLVTKPDPKSVYQKTEITGPNVALFKVSDLDEVADIVNQTQFGVAASIYTSNRETYLRLIEEATAGLLYWNRPTVESTFRLPYGGLKKSANARPMGSFSGYQCTYPVASLEDKHDNPRKGTKSLPETLPRLEE